MKKQRVYIINEDLMNQLDEAISTLQCIFCDIFSNYEIQTGIKRKEFKQIERIDLERDN